MSCGCSSTTISSSINCGGCGYQCTSCICPGDPLVMPDVVCPDPVACDELYQLECIEYTGDDIKCSTTASTLYPNVTHIVATKGDLLNTVLGNINNQLCYLFSADYIAQMLSNIDNDDELHSLFCSIICGSAPTALICPTVSPVTYNYDATSSQYYLSAQINYVPYATIYNYKFYVETATGVYDTEVGSGTILQPATALPIIFNAVINNTTYPSTSKYAVLIQAIDGTSTYTSKGVAPLNVPSSSFVYATVAAANPNNCGINKYDGTPSSIICNLLNLNGAFKASASNTKALQFSFTQETSNILYIPVVGYTVHWYLQSVVPSISYIYQGNNSIGYSSGALQLIDVYKLPVTVTFTKASTLVTITSPAHGLISGMNIKIDNAVSTDIPANSYIISYLTANTFTITTPGSSTVASPTTVIYESQLNPTTDKVVVMISTTTNDVECFKGIPKRVNGSFTDAEMTTYLSNPNNNAYKNF